MVYKTLPSFFASSPQHSRLIGIGSFHLVHPVGLPKRNYKAYKMQKIQLEQMEQVSEPDVVGM